MSKIHWIFFVFFFIKRGEEFLLLTHFDNDDFENILLLKMGHKPNPKNICRFHRHLFLLTHHKTLISSAVPDPRGLSCIPSLNTQSCIRRPLCSTLNFENLRSPKKKRFKIHYYFFKNFSKKNLTSFYATF